MSQITCHKKERGKHPVELVEAVLAVKAFVQLLCHSTNMTKHLCCLGCWHVWVCNSWVPLGAELAQHSCTMPAAVDCSHLVNGSGPTRSTMGHFKRIPETTAHSAPLTKHIEAVLALSRDKAMSIFMWQKSDKTMTSENQSVFKTKLHNFAPVVKQFRRG